MAPNIWIVQICILSCVYFSANGFNFSPQPSYMIREPKLKYLVEKSRSSYFGFTINLRNSSIIVGAPRAQSAVEKFNETGAIYKCNIEIGTCTTLTFVDQNKSFNKDHQWLGASMDGGPRDSDELVVCAPRHKTYSEERSEYLMNGVCYWRSDTLSGNAMGVKVIAPLRLASSQYKHLKGSTYHYYRFGEQGLSVHITSNNQEILIGAPGILSRAGSVIRYRHGNGQDDTAVPSSELFVQGSDMYFGYSVGSGNFDNLLPNKTFYVASEPKSIQSASGRVYIFNIFEISRRREQKYSIEKLFTFRGSQFGEFFGYAVLAEDLNGDGLSDLIVTAPQYTSDDIVDQGAIYVFINEGIKGTRLSFKLQKLIKSPINTMGGRFGSSISKIGDINHDGFNDIAVGAPFADNGAVFIYLGSAKGLREVSSQQLTAGPLTTTWGSKPMFGHGLSKGFDIDNNGFNDLAIGAPEAEAVFVYRSYPVVKIHAAINTLSPQVKLKARTTFQIEICYRIYTTSPNVKSQYLQIDVNANADHVLFDKSNSTAVRLVEKALTNNQCRSLDAKVRLNTTEIFKPVKFTMNYSLVNKIPRSGENFCGKCAAVDPTDLKAAECRIVFTTGCKTNICMADLKLISSGVDPTYTFGSSRTISVTYEVSNSGETAYLPQINITSSNKVSFFKIPPSCAQYDSNVNDSSSVLLCDLNRGQPMSQNTNESLTIIFDVSQAEKGSSLNLTAVAFSAGDERNPADNVISDIIALEEFTKIEVFGVVSTKYTDLDKVFNSTEITNEYEVKNGGPSKIEELKIAFEIPIAYRLNGSTELITVVEVNSIKVQCSYSNQELNVNSGKTFARRNAVEFFKDSKKLNSTDALGRYSRSIEKVETPIRSELLSEEALVSWSSSSLPTNTTIVIDCFEPETSICAKGIIKVNQFVPDTEIKIALKYQVDLIEVGKILTEPWENFLIVPKLEMFRVGDVYGNTTLMTMTNVKYNEIFKHRLYKSQAPWWLMCLAILGGLLIFAGIAYKMHRAGFFLRKWKEETAKLVRNGPESN